MYPLDQAHNANLVERPDKKGIQKMPMIESHAHNATDKLKVLEVVGVDAAPRVDLHS
jgi:hypothetical protein